MIEARIAKIVMIASLALFAFVVTFDNITDYDTNFEFVRHVQDRRFRSLIGMSMLENNVIGR